MSDSATTGEFTLSASADDFTGEIRADYQVVEGTPADGESDHTNYVVSLSYKITTDRYSNRSGADITVDLNLTSDGQTTPHSVHLESGLQDEEWHDFGAPITLRAQGTGTATVAHVARFIFDKPGMDPHAQGEHSIEIPLLHS
jgi:hypothetical protein